MFDLKALASASDRLKARDTRRQDQGERHYREALELVAQYEGSHRLETLETALNLLATAVSANRRHAKAWALMASIFYALRAYQPAAQYLQNALAIDPNEADALALQQLMRQARPIPLVSEAAAPDAPAYSDAQIDYLEDKLDAIGQQLRTLQVEPRPVLSAAQLEAITQLRDSLQASQRFLADALGGLGDEMDTASLQLKLQSIESLVWQLNQLLALSDKFRHQASELELLASAVAAFEASNGSQPDKDARFELLLDRCDAMADWLDEMAAKQVPIEALEPSYTALVKDLRELQDRLEED